MPACRCKDLEGGGDSSQDVSLDTERCEAHRPHCPIWVVWSFLGRDQRSGWASALRGTAGPHGGCALRMWFASVSDIDTGLVHSQVRRWATLFVTVWTPPTTPDLGVTVVCCVEGGHIHP